MRTPDMTSSWYVPLLTVVVMALASGCASHARLNSPRNGCCERAPVCDCPPCAPDAFRAGYHAPQWFELDPASAAHVFRPPPPAAEAPVEDQLDRDVDQTEADPYGDSLPQQPEGDDFDTDGFDAPPVPPFETETVPPFSADPSESDDDASDGSLQDDLFGTPPAEDGGPAGDPFSDDLPAEEGDSPFEGRVEPDRLPWRLSGDAAGSEQQRTAAQAAPRDRAILLTPEQAVMPAGGPWEPVRSKPAAGDLRVVRPPTAGQRPVVQASAQLLQPEPAPTTVPGNGPAGVLQIAADATGSARQIPESATADPPRAVPQAGIRFVTP